MTAPDDPWGPVPDADPLDELARALGDGEATDEELAAADDPDVAARVAAFEALTRRVGEPVPSPPDADRDAAIRAALGALPSAVPSLDTARQRRAARRRGLPQWFPAVAAIVAVIAGLGLLIAALPDTGDDDDAASDAAATMESQEGASGAGDETIADDSEATAPAADDGPAAFALSEDLGAFPDVPTLVDALRARSSTSSGAEGTEDVEESASRSGARELGACGFTADDVLTAVVADDEVAIAITNEATGGRSYEVVDVITCEVLESGAL